jgi:hypothetical protein
MSLEQDPSDALPRWTRVHTRTHTDEHGHVVGTTQTYTWPHLPSTMNVLLLATLILLCPPKTLARGIVLVLVYNCLKWSEP